MAIKVVDGGMGGFLKPPKFPENFLHLEVDGEKFSLTAALYSTKLNVAARIIARKIIEAWEAPIDLDWVRRVLGYYKHAWRNPALEEPECWFNCNIFYCVDPICASYTDHFGTHWVWNFYPDYWPTEEDFEKAYFDGKLSCEREGVDIVQSVLYSATNSLFKKPEPELKLIGYDPCSRLPAAVQATITSVIKSGQDCRKELLQSPQERVLKTLRPRVF